jgi:hypothetical protein
MIRKPNFIQKPEGAAAITGAIAMMPRLVE